MLHETSAGYVVDVPYARRFYKELGPPLLRAALSLNGLPAPPADDFDYCELGCAHGDTLVTLAAAHPRARFVGVDIIPEHIATARALTDRGGLDNVRFIERDFEALDEDALPDFDFISAHGVLSWVAIEKMRALFAFAGKKLKPRGLLYVSYNALPGWAAVEPLRRLLVETSKDVASDTLTRARRGIELAQRMHDGGAVYFDENPSAKEMLATIARMGLPYAVHEYFHAHWRPMYFADVARELTPFDLHFAGELPLYRNVHELTIPPALADHFRGVHDRVAFESLKDFATNQFFRQDVYVKRSPAPSASITHEYLEATPFGTIVPAARVAREVGLGRRALRFEGAIFDALIAKLAERAATLPELLRDATLASFDAETIRAAALQLLFAEQIAPRIHATPATLPPLASRPRVVLPYNRAILEQSFASKAPIVLAAPSAGTGVELPSLRAVALRALTEVDPSERPRWIRAFVERHALNLVVGDKHVDDKSEQAKILLAQLEQFVANEAPKLIELGILDA
jgi:SAM-dependent methyltransferase